MKLDIAKAIGSAFSVLFGKISGVLQIAWLPVAIQLAAYFLVMPSYVRGTGGLSTATNAEESARAFAQAIPSFGMMGVLLLVTAFTNAAMVVGLTRLALRGETPRTPFYIGWGGAEWRLLGGWGILVLIICGLAVVLQGGAALLPMVLGRGPQTAIIGILMNVVLLVAVIWVCVRLSLVAPATVATGKMSLRESWDRTDDDFWNFLGLWLLLCVIFFIIYMVVYFTLLLPKGYFETFQGITPNDRDSVREAMQKANDLMIASYDWSVPANVAKQAVAAIIGPIICIVFALAGAMAWKLTAETSEA